MPMQPDRARHWFRTLLPAGASCPAAEADGAVEAGRSMLRQVVTVYSGGLVATLAFIA